jgi:hypothetical protein
MILALALVVPALAMAADFTYSTTGSFSGGGCSGSSCTVGGATLSFAGATGGPTAPGHDVSMGMFSNTVPSGSSGNSFDGISFTLSVLQSAPGVGTGNIVGTLYGTIDYNGSTGTLQFVSSNALSTSIATGGLITIYTLDTTLSPGACSGIPNCISLGGQNQSAALTGFVTQVPEPASIMMFGTGLTGLAGLVRRRLKK